jgi:flagellar biosynthesis regulator FlbT
MEYLREDLLDYYMNRNLLSSIVHSDGIDPSMDSHISKLIATGRFWEAHRVTREVLLAEYENRADHFAPVSSPPWRFDGESLERCEAAIVHYGSVYLIVEVERVKKLKSGEDDQEIPRKTVTREEAEKMLSSTEDLVVTINLIAVLKLVRQQDYQQALQVCRDFTKEYESREKGIDENTLLSLYSSQACIIFYIHQQARRALITAILECEGEDGRFLEEEEDDVLRAGMRGSGGVASLWHAKLIEKCLQEERVDLERAVRLKKRLVSLYKANPSLNQLKEQSLQGFEFNRYVEETIAGRVSSEWIGSQFK